MKRFWQEKYVQFSESGMSLAEFCALERLHPTVAERRFKAFSGSVAGDSAVESVGFWEFSPASGVVESVELETPAGLLVRIGSISIADLQQLLV
ncbi:MAG: IS66 family insertion sequence element accessory protein TnpA [Candidatus Planktophila sp.]